MRPTNRPLLIAAVSTVLLLAFAAFAAPHALRTFGGVPQGFDRDFLATGKVEAVEPVRGPFGGCEVRVAVYDWINLSPGFPLAEIPQTNDRFRLRGDPQTCDALAVSMATTNDHISFTAGKARGRWYFAAAPNPAVGCGGLEIGWTPGEVNRLF